MSDTQQNNKRILKNTVALYIRSFITLAIGFYTSRIMLKALGVDDFGINNLVGSVVGMSAVISGAVSAAITRYITYALGDGDIPRMKVVFSTSVNVMIILSVLAVIVLELFGLWFINLKADIPQNGVIAANWVLQFSILSLVINFLSSPYNATILAHEHMSIYAYMSIVEAGLKLGACFAIMAFRDNRLIIFAFFNALIALGLRIFYSWYCQHNFHESQYDRKLFDKAFLKEMFQFTGWYAVGNVVWVLNTQGVNMLINTFFGVVLNATRGIALTVTSGIATFVNNFTVAFIPQITKSYASGDMNRLLFLIFQGTKMTWFLVLLFIIPVFWESKTLLKLWLGTPPEYSDIFLRFALFESWSMVISFALHHTIMATGKLKRVQLQLAVYTSLIFPITWICFYHGVSAWYSCIIFIIINTTAKGFSLYELKRLINFPISLFMKNCVVKCTLITIVAFTVPGIIVYMMPESLTRFFIVIVISIIWTLFCSYFIGLNQSEKIFIKTSVNNSVKKFIIKGA